jgi:hypothetical protein
MSGSKVSIATLAPVPDEPVHFGGPTLPAAPADLAQGATGLGPLKVGPLLVSTLPGRYLVMGMIPVAVGALVTLISLFLRWPALLPALGRRQRFCHSERSEESLIFFQAPGWGRAARVLVPSAL